jgi:hypothetical protein
MTKKINKQIYINFINSEADVSEPEMLGVLMRYIFFENYKEFPEDL